MKNFILCLLLLVMGTANLWADKYYRIEHHTSPARYSQAADVVGKNFMIYNTAFYSGAMQFLNEKLNYTPGTVTSGATSVTNIKVNDQVYTLTDEDKQGHYVDITKTGSVFKVEPGETIQPYIATSGSWVHGYAFLDYDADGFTTSKDTALLKSSNQLPVVQDVEKRPDYLFYMRNANGIYSTGTTGRAGNNVADRGKFAFYAVEDKEDTYYIYSHSARKWLSYEKAGSYSNQQNFITLTDDKTEGAYFKIRKYNDGYYDIAPYNNTGVAQKYLNWYLGNGDRLGLWQQNANQDNGSKFFLTEVESVDLVSFSYYNEKDETEQYGWNSAGDKVTDRQYSHGGAMPSFTAPTKQGLYRMRYKLDWNNIDPGVLTQNDYRGLVIDFVLEVGDSNTDHTGFLYNAGTALGLTKHKGRDLMIYNECHLFTLEEAGEENAYYIKSVSTGSYVNIDGNTNAKEKVYIYTWGEATGIKDDDLLDTYNNKTFLTNGTIKQAVNYNIELPNYTVIQPHLVDQSADNKHQVFIITNEAKDKYWCTSNGLFSTAGEGQAFAFLEATDVDEAYYSDIQDLHIYSRVDLYSAQQIYGYVHDAGKYSSNYPPENNDGSWYDGDNALRYGALIDFDSNTFFHSAWQGNCNEAKHYLQADLDGVATKAFRFYFKKRIHSNNSCPTKILIYGSNDGTDFGDTPIATIESGFPTAADELEYISPIINCDNGGTGYKYLRFVMENVQNNGNENNNFFAFSEFYVLPSRPEINDALNFLDTSLPIVATAKKYSEIVNDYNTRVPETKLLSGVPLSGNKYFIYADAYNGTAFENLHLHINDNGDVIASASDTYYNAADKDYYVWVCEETVSGTLLFRNAKTGRYLADAGGSTDTPFEWTINTNETFRHGVPLKNSSQQYLCVGNDGNEWLGDVKFPQDQTSGLLKKYVTETVTNDNGTPDDTNDDFEEEVTRIDFEQKSVCTDFVFLPVDRDTSKEKKVTIWAQEYAMYNSNFYYNGTKNSLPFAQIISSSLPALDFDYSFVATLQNGDGWYAASSTDNVSVQYDGGKAEAGSFVFQAVPDKENAYYIYSLDEEKWLDYEVLSGYSNGENKVWLSVDKNADAYFFLQDVNDESYKLLSPSKNGNAASIYINWYNGVDENTSFGFYGTGADDPGSRWNIIALAETNVSIEEICGDYHQFVGYYKKDAATGNEVCLTTEKTLDYSNENLEDGDYVEARFEIVKPFELSNGTDIRLYTIKNVYGNNYAMFRGDDAQMTLVDEAGVNVLNYFYFTNGEENDTILKNSHSSAFIEHVVTTKKLDDSGAVNSGTPARWTNSGQLYYMQPKLSGGQMGYTISKVKLPATTVPNGWCGAVIADDVDPLTLHDNQSGVIGAYNVNDKGAVWVFEEVENPEVDIKDYIESLSISIKGSIAGQTADIYDATKQAAYTEYVTNLATEAATAELVRLVNIAQELYGIYHTIGSLTLSFPEQTTKWGNDYADYAPHWYLVKNVKSGTAIAEYTEDLQNMALYNGDESKLAHMFYFGGTMHNKAGDAIDEYEVGAYLQACIHNFAAHYHSGEQNTVVDKTLVSKDEVLFENCSIVGTGKEDQNFNIGGDTLKNTVAWRIVLEGNSNGNTQNAWGSTILATDKSLKDDYWGGFQIYLKATGFIMFKWGIWDSDAYNFQHTQDKFATYKVVIDWKPNDGAVPDANGKVNGTITVTVANSLGDEESYAKENHGLKDVTVLTTAIPQGVNVTAMSGEIIKSQSWNEKHDDSNWYILPSSNKTYPGLAIVTDGPNDANQGWTNKDGADAKIDMNRGDNDYSTWQFERITDFKPYMNELIDLWDLNDCTIYYAPLVKLYEDLLELYNNEAYDETTFNQMIYTIRQYHELPKEDFLAPTAGKFYTIRPANSVHQHTTALSVNDKNELVNKAIYTSEAYDDKEVYDGEYDSRGIFLFEEIDAEGGVTAFAKNLHTLSYINDVAAGSESVSALSETDAQTITLHPIGSSVVNIQVGDAADSYLNYNIDGDSCVYAGEKVDLGNDVTNVYNVVSSWIIEEISAEDYEKIYHSTKVNDSGLGSLMLSYTSKVPEGIEAFYPCSSGLVASKKYVSMKSYGEPGDAERLVPAETAVILRVQDGYEKTGNYKFYYSPKTATDPADKATPQDDGIAIGGSLYKTLIDASKHDDEFGANKDSNIYMYLKSSATNIAWIYENYRADGTKTGNNDDGGYFNCNANRAYIALAKDKALNAATLSFRFDGWGTTGIDEIGSGERGSESAVAIEGVYDLQGRKLKEISEPGIYIVNGKKVVVK